MKLHNRTRATLSRNLKVSRDPKKGCAATLNSFVEAARPALGVIGEPMDLNGSSNEAVVLWVEVKPIINAASEKMKDLLNRFTVSPAVRSCLYRQFDAIAVLVEVFLSVLPHVDLEDEDEENTVDDANSRSGRSDDVNTSSLREVLSEVEDKDEPANEKVENEYAFNETVAVDVNEILFAEDGEN